MESLEGSPWGEDSLEKNSIRSMYRDVIIGAVHDLGYGTAAEVAAVHRWRKSESFDICCDLARWDTGWVNSVMMSVAALPSAAAREVTKQCVGMLKAVAKSGEVSKGEIGSIGFRSRPFLGRTSGRFTITGERDE